MAKWYTHTPTHPLTHTHSHTHTQTQIIKKGNNNTPNRDPHGSSLGIGAVNGKTSTLEVAEIVDPLHSHVSASWLKVSQLQLVYWNIFPFLIDFFFLIFASFSHSLFGILYIFNTYQQMTYIKVTCSSRIVNVHFENT